jgi:hypothetical protein
MVLTKQNNTDLTPEQKLGLNLTKDLFTVLTSDTEKVASLKGDIIFINEVLNKGNEEEITYCNKNMLIFQLRNCKFSIKDTRRRCQEI